MFAATKTIVFLTQANLSLLRVSLGKNPSVTTRANYDYTPETILKVFQTIQKELHGSFRLLLSEDLVYVFTLSVPPSHLSNREEIKRLAQEQIPDNLDETTWDYKEMLLTKPQAKPASVAIVQVVAMQKHHYDNLKLVFEKLRLHTECIESVSTALTRMVSHEKDPLLLLFLDKFPLLIMAQHGLVVTTERFYEPLTTAKIDSFSGFVKERFLLSPTKILLCGQTQRFNTAIFEQKKQHVQIVSLNPAVGIALKQDIKGNDENVLNLEIPAIHPATSKPTPLQNEIAGEENEEGSADALPVKKKSPKNKILLAIFLILVNAGMLAFAGMYFLRSVQPPKTISSEKKPIPTVTSSPTPTPAHPTPTVSLALLSTYPITVFNGSGIPGKAASLAATLSEQGFVVSLTANASASNYQTTQIFYDQSVPTEVKSILDNFLKTLYVIRVGEKLQEQSTTPITIIVGQQ